MTTNHHTITTLAPTTAAPLPGADTTTADTTADTTTADTTTADTPPPGLRRLRALAEPPAGDVLAAEAARVLEEARITSLAGRLSMALYDLGLNQVLPEGWMETGDTVLGFAPLGLRQLDRLVRALEDLQVVAPEHPRPAPGQQSLICAAPRWSTRRPWSCSPRR